MPRRPRTLIFDCDGVLLDSNPIKTDAFAEVASRFGNNAAERLVAYHREHAGVSRFDKFRYLLEEVLGRSAEPDIVAELSDAFGESVSRQLLSCEAATGLETLRARTANMAWMVVSGGAQDELRRVFSERGLAAFFDGGIHGSPDDKDTIFAREIASGNLQQPALYVGDSRYDHEAATRAGFDFIFVSRWTNFSGWRAYCEAHGIRSVDSVEDLIALPELGG